MKFMRVKTAAIALASWCLASSASALVITDTQAFSISNTAFTSTTGKSSSYGDSVFNDVSLDGFDSSLGTLTGVSISLKSFWTSHTIGGAVDFKGRRNNDTWVKGKGISDYSVTLLDPWGEDPVSRTARNHVSCDSRSYGFNACYDLESKKGKFNTSFDILNIDISKFLNDDITVRLNNEQFSSLRCDNNDRGDLCSLKTKGSWEGKISVNYQYNVPNAGTLGLLIAGLTGLIMFRRRQNG